jgi:hypothetical protein
MPESTTLAAALLGVQRELKNPTKSHTAKVPIKGGGSYSYQYASLDDTLAELLPTLNAAGITLLQPMVSDQYTVGVRTILQGFGEEMDLGTLVMPTNPDPQKVGAIITYMRRYALGSLGLVAEDDTDGAGIGNDSAPSGTTHGTGNPAIASEAQIKAVWGKSKALGMSEAALVAAIKRDTEGRADHPDRLTKPDATMMLDKMQKAIDEKAA